MSSFQDIDSSAIIGDGTKIYNFVYIGEYVTIGDNCLIANFVHIDHDTTIGNNVKIMCMVHVPEYTKIGNNVNIFPNVCLINEKYPPTHRKVGAVIEDDCIIGSGSIINAGVTIGKGSVIGAGSLVLKNVPPQSVVFGSPAHRHFSRAEYDEKQKDWIESGLSGSVIKL